MKTTLIGTNHHASRTITIGTHGAALTTYAPFGTAVRAPDFTLSMPDFNGARLDPVNGSFLLGNGYRSYSPVLNRFVCPDMDSPFGVGGFNPYVYCQHDPVNLIDPSGHGVIRRIRKATARVIRRFRGNSGESMCSCLGRTLRKRNRHRDKSATTPEDTATPSYRHRANEDDIIGTSHSTPPSRQVFSHEFTLSADGNYHEQTLGYTPMFGLQNAPTLLLHGTPDGMVGIFDVEYMNLARERIDAHLYRRFSPRELIDYLDARGINLRGSGDDDTSLFLIACHIHVFDFPKELAFRLNRPVVTFGEGGPLQARGLYDLERTGAANITVNREPQDATRRAAPSMKHLPGEWDQMNR